MLGVRRLGAQSSRLKAQRRDGNDIGGDALGGSAWAPGSGESSRGNRGERHVRPDFSPQLLCSSTPLLLNFLPTPNPQLPTKERGRFNRLIVQRDREETASGRTGQDTSHAEACWANVSVSNPEGVDCLKSLGNSLDAPVVNPFRVGDHSFPAPPVAPAAMEREALQASGSDIPTEHTAPPTPGGFS